MDLKKALNVACTGGRGDLTLEEVTLPKGTMLRDVQIDTPEDDRQLQAIVGEASQQAAPQRGKRPTAQPSGRLNKGDTLGQKIGVHVRDLERAGRQKKTVLDSRHTLRLFAGIVGDTPVATLSSNDCRLFFDETCICNPA